MNKMEPIMRFGPFQVDSQAGELRKSGTRIRLQEQPLRILGLLLERPGEIVSREEIQQRLWATDTFVDFEHSLNTAVNRLRSALGDSADHPRYIETVPRRGYRFIGKLQGDQSDEDGITQQSTGSRPQDRVPLWAFAAVAGSLAATWVILAAVWLGSSPKPVEAPLRSFTLPLPAEGSEIERALMSPDGSHIVYGDRYSGGVLWIHDLQREETRVLRERSATGYFGFFWSPRSDFVGLVLQAGAVIAMPVAGGSERTIGQVAPTAGLDGAWSEDGQSIFVAANGLFELSVGGAGPTPLAQGSFYYPARLPGRRRLLTTLATFAEIRGSETLRQTEIVALDLERGRREVIAKGARAVWSPTGHVLYEYLGNVLAAPFSPESMQRTGSPFPIREGAWCPSLSEDGSLVYLTGGRGLQQLVWRDRGGREIGLIGEPQERLFGPALSPNGDRVAVVGWQGDFRDIWIHEVSRPQKRPLTLDAFRDDRPIWTLEGDRIAFTSLREGKPTIWLVHADGGGKAEVLVEGEHENYGNGWSADSRFFLFTQLKLGTGGDLWYLKRNEDRKGYEQAPFLVDRFDTLAPQLSPDGRFVAYSSSEAGQQDIWVQPFPDGGSKWMVSTGGGRAPRWRGDGKELFYVAGDPGPRGGFTNLTSKNPPVLMAVPVTTSPGFTFGTAKRLFADPHLAGRGHTYDVSLDGQKFVTVKTIQEAPKTQIHVVQNWYAEFRNRQ